MTAFCASCGTPRLSQEDRFCHHCGEPHPLAEQPLTPAPTTEQIDPDEWYYVSQGKRLGPVTQESLLGLLHDGKVFADTPVWHKGLPTWLPVHEAGLAPDTPPPLKADAISDWAVWLIAFLPILLVLGRNLIGYGLGASFVVAFLLYSTLALIDLNMIKRAGHDTRTLGQGWIFFVPVYLWKRAKILGDSSAYFWTFIGALILSAL